MFVTQTACRRLPLGGLALLLSAAGSLTATAQTRTWTNDEGQTMQADFVRYRGSTVYLKEDRKIHRVPFERLSADDQAYAEAAAECTKYRDWTTPQGKTFRGRYEGHESGEVEFKTREGKERVAYYDLIADDQALLMAFTEGEIGQAAGEPPETLVPRALVTEERGQGERVWTDVRGKKIVAEYRGVEADKVVLFFKNREWRVPLTRLSEADQAFARSLAEPQMDVAASSGAEEPPEAREEPKNIRVETQGGRTRVWADDEEVFGAEASRIAALLEQRQLELQQRHDDFVKETEQRMAELRQKPRESLVATAEGDRESAGALASQRSPGPDIDYLDVAPAELEASEAVSMTPSEPAPGGAVEPEPLLNSYFCFSCEHEWESARELGVGDTCPNCGVRFDEAYDEDDDESGGFSIRGMRRTVRLGIFLVVMLVSFIGWLGRKFYGSSS